MGVEYVHYLIPKPNSFIPTPEDLERFVASATARQWIPRTNPDVRTVGEDRVWAWPCESPLLLDPLTPARTPAGERTHEFKIHLAGDYVYHASECIDPFDSTACSCGADLEFERDEDLFSDLRLRAKCLECGQDFDPSDLPAGYRHPVTGEASLLLGGAAYRFAILIDCGKSVPSETMEARAVPEFLEHCQAELRTPLYEVGDVY